jgi:hypothetical protein
MPRLLPKKIYEAWFAVTRDGVRVGRDWLFFEPHADRTGWFERKAAIEGGRTVEVAARFALRDWPDLRWCRFREGERSLEMAVEGSGEAIRTGTRLLAASGDLVPSAVLPLLAASAPRAPGATLRMSLLREREARVERGWVLVSHGPETIDLPGGALSVTRYTAGPAEGGAAVETYWVDEARRIRRIDYGCSPLELAPAGPPGALSALLARRDDVAPGG